MGGDLGGDLLRVSRNVQLYVTTRIQCGPDSNNLIRRLEDAEASEGVKDCSFALSAASVFSRVQR